MILLSIIYKGVFMSSIIDENDKIWRIFLGYTRLIDEKATSSGIDIYGTEQRSTLALGLAQANMTEQLVCKLNDMEKQQQKQHRSTKFIQGTVDA